MSQSRLFSSTSASPVINSKSATAPSGIARLRHSVNNEPEPTDQMNLDDFILPSSVGSPSGLSASPLVEGSSRSGNAVASAIPIKRQRPQQQQPPSLPQSQPSSRPEQHQQHHHPSQDPDQEIQIPYGSAPSQPPRPRLVNEFGYVQRHVRKTSIDERRV